MADEAALYIEDTSSHVCARNAVPKGNAKEKPETQNNKGR